MGWNGGMDNGMECTQTEEQKNGGGLGTRLECSYTIKKERNTIHPTA